MQKHLLNVSATNPGSGELIKQFIALLDLSFHASLLERPGNDLNLAPYIR